MFVGGYWDTNRGEGASRVRVFDWTSTTASDENDDDDNNSGTCVELGVPLEGDASENFFGRAIFASTDGTRMIVGGMDSTCGETSPMTRCGLVRVYETNRHPIILPNSNTTTRK